MPKGIQHSEETVQLGLRVLALCGGQVAQASRLLASEGYEIHRNTLTGWKNRTYAHRYHEMLHEYRQEIAEAASDRAMELAGRAQSVSAQLIEKTEEKIDEIPAKDLARSALAATQVTAEQTRTGRLLREQPTHISEIREPAEIIAELKAAGIVKQDETIDVEVVDGPVQ